MADQFVLDLQKFAKLTEDKITLALRKIILEIFTRVVERTPVRDGRARGGWQVGINVRPEGETSRIDKDGSPTISAGEADILRAMLRDEIWICNGVPYIGILETGSSTQAPHGFLAITLREFQQIVKSAPNK
ncbi:hypothetical protein JL100_017965 [Skermanella mucosa]|uniref:HK97 gp10 family phage protein n=1 Tax=Skermanella mucosa TaxID=1789672 RepID=UPI00192A7935|nr:HK97 gp10 family phage protein [Skermanella mucosa]UEM18972.1 hypothetical protein JL100_017965 [Skermanella mucosa]